MDSKDFKLEIKSVTICEIVRRQLTSFFNEFKRKGIEPKLNFQEDNIYVNADEKALNKILNNIISNALKYGKNSTKICIDISYTKGMVFTSIWDNGLGIPKDEINYIFDRLYTVEKSRKLNLKSSDLGLSIVKKLVESLGGTISATSIPLKKTEFNFTLIRIELFSQKTSGKDKTLLQRIGSIIEYPGFYPNLTARENLEIHRRMMGVQEKDFIDNSLKIVGIENAKDKKVKEFSLGMKQRLGIARALLHHPEFLILDEPTNGLDPIGIKEIRELIINLSHKQGITFLISSHILSEIQQMATKIGIIHKGILLEE